MSAVRAKVRARASTWMAARSVRRDVASRTLPDFVRVPSAGQPTIHYIAPMPTNASGGVRVIHRHVDLLNEMGWQAQMVHPSHAPRIEWFAHSTRLVQTMRLEVAEHDVLVIPEFYAVRLQTLPPWCRTVIFNQGGYLTFDLVDHQAMAGKSLYRDLPTLAGVLTPSRDSQVLLQHTFPGIDVATARPVVDPSVFHPPRADEPPAARRFAYFTSRRPEELHQLLHILRERGIDWEPVPIAGRSESEVAAILRSCAVFLSFSERDGFGLPPAEAMASGCYVVGYTGGGGDEFFLPEFCSPVNHLLGFAQAAEAAMATPLEELAAAGRAASRHVHAAYSVDGLRADLAAFWSYVLGPPRDAPTETPPVAVSTSHSGGSA